MHLKNSKCRAGSWTKIRERVVDAIRAVIELLLTGIYGGNHMYEIDVKNTGKCMVQRHLLIPHLEYLNLCLVNEDNKDY